MSDRACEGWARGRGILGSALLCLGALSATGAERTVPMVAHQHPSGAFSFRTPASWQVGVTAGRKDVLEAQGEEGVVWFIHHTGTSGFDSQHVNCMGERLAGTLATSSVMGYEYDFKEGAFAGRMALDSAFVVSYASPARGEAAWRQRNVTLIGNGETLCIVAFSPALKWKKSKPLRRTMDAVVGSISFSQQP